MYVFSDFEGRANRYNMSFKFKIEREISKRQYYNLNKLKIHSINSQL